MLGQSIGLVSCALGASALLIPPSVAFHKDGPLSTYGVDTKSQVLELPCPSCDWVLHEDVGAIRSATEEEHNLLLNFTISEDGQGLLVNDHFVYPFSKLLADDNAMAVMTVDQIPASTTNEQIHDNSYTRVPLVVKGSGLSEGETVHAPGTDLISLTWQLLAVEENAIDVDMVNIQLIRTEDDELLILSLDHSAALSPEPFSPHPKVQPPRPHKRPCHMPGPLCAVADFIGSTFGKSGRPFGKPCTGHKHKFDGEHLPTHIRPHIGRPHPVDEPMPNWMLESGPHPPHHGHRHGHHRHGFFHSVSHAILAVLIPIMAGITIGIIVSTLGLLFGRLLGYLWFTAFRGGRRGYTAVAAEEGHASEKEATEDEQPLPRYEEAPAYEEVATDGKISI